MSKEYKSHIKKWQENGYKIIFVGKDIFAEKDGKIFFLGLTK